MPALNNHRRELFTQLLFQGYSAAKAYEKAGYKRHDGNASTLAKHPEVQARLEEIRGATEKIRGAAGSGLPVGTRAIAARQQITTESLIEDAQRLYDKGLENGQLSAAVSALKEKGVPDPDRVRIAFRGRRQQTHPCHRTATAIGWSALWSTATACA